MLVPTEKKLVARFSAIKICSKLDAPNF